MINPVKGTHDIVYEDSAAFANIELRAKFIATQYNYREMIIPIIEHRELYTRSVGESSDIVRKEMYEFLDKGGRELALRPEFTAGVMRAIASNKLYVNRELPLKYFYCGPCFRYERPQAGRYRQFYQFGIEAIGEPSSYLDSEAIIIGHRILESLGKPKLKVKINTLGDEESRKRYKEALINYFKDHIDEMCDDCKARLLSNPLRILDCKVEHDKEIVRNAPKIDDYLSDDAKIYFKSLLYTIKANGINYVIDDNLVRGLDYYSGVVWEYVAEIKKGEESLALGGGGHYNNLLKEVGGPDYEGVGFSLGIERLMDLLRSQISCKIEGPGPDFYASALNEDALDMMFSIVQKLRDNGIMVHLPYKVKSISSALKCASKMRARFALLLGDDELNKGSLIAKNMQTGEQRPISMRYLKRDVFKLMNDYFNEKKE